LVEYFVTLAEKLLSLANFDGAAAVIAGLNHSSILRLKSLWNNLNEKVLEKFNEIDALFSPQQNFSHYRELLQQLPPSTPCIPYHGLIPSSVLIPERTFLIHFFRNSDL